MEIAVPKNVFELSMVAWMIVSVVVLFIFYAVLKLPYRTKRRWHPLLCATTFLVLIAICYLTLPIQQTVVIAPAVVVAHP